MKTKAKTRSRRKTKARRKVKQALVYIQTTYNNTIISVTDQSGNVLSWSSAGKVGFSGTRKATPYAAQRAVTDVIEQIQPFGIEEVHVFVKGIGSARESAIRALSGGDITIASLRDITPIPHNGVRAAKRRRV